VEGEGGGEGRKGVGLQDPVALEVFCILRTLRSSVEAFVQEGKFNHTDLIKGT
jgi:hypothetical protein